MNKWRARARTLIVSCSRVSWIRWLLRKLCQLGTWEVGRRLANLPGVESIYVRHSHPESATFAPGLSDLDLTLVLDDAAARSSDTIRACAGELDSLNRVFYFVWPRDTRFVTRRELAQMEHMPGAAEILNTPKHWRRIGGQEVRNANSVPAVALDYIANHPEFNAWWLNVLQTHVLTPQAPFAETNMRLCFRVAMKNQIHLQSARAPLDFVGESYVPDSKAAALFAGNPEMAHVMAAIKARDFRAVDSQREKVVILERCIAEAADCYRRLPAPMLTQWRSLVGEDQSLSEGACTDLLKRFEQAPALRSLLASAIIYPTPHWSAGHYQIDLILKDKVPSAVFKTAVGEIKTVFQGRTFGFEGNNAQLSLIPKVVYEHPFFFLGTPFPFLHEHVSTYGRLLFGDLPCIPAPPRRSERLMWCSRYFLFHRLTLARRPTYLSKDCNFCQLAALRLFLEWGVIFTDSAQVRSQYVRRVVPNVEGERGIAGFVPRRLPGDGRRQSFPFRRHLPNTDSRVRRHRLLVT